MPTQNSIGKEAVVNNYLQYHFHLVDNDIFLFCGRV